MSVERSVRSVGLALAADLRVGDERVRADRGGDDCQIDQQPLSIEKKSWVPNVIRSAGGSALGRRFVCVVSALLLKLPGLFTRQLMDNGGVRNSLRVKGENILLAS